MTEPQKKPNKPFQNKDIIEEQMEKSYQNIPIFEVSVVDNILLWYKVENILERLKYKSIADIKWIDIKEEENDENRASVQKTADELTLLSWTINKKAANRNRKADLVNQRQWWEVIPYIPLKILLKDAIVDKIEESLKKKGAEYEHINSFEVIGSMLLITIAWHTSPIVKQEKIKIDIRPWIPIGKILIEYEAKIKRKESFLDHAKEQILPWVLWVTMLYHPVTQTWAQWKSWYNRTFWETKYIKLKSIVVNWDNIIVNKVIKKSDFLIEAFRISKRQWYKFNSKSMEFEYKGTKLEKLKSKKPIDLIKFKDIEKAIESYTYEEYKRDMKKMGVKEADMMTNKKFRLGKKLSILELIKLNDNFNVNSKYSPKMSFWKCVMKNMTKLSLAVWEKALHMIMMPIFFKEIQKYSWNFDSYVKALLEWIGFTFWFKAWARIFWKTPITAFFWGLFWWGVALVYWEKALTQWTNTKAYFDKNQPNSEDYAERVLWFDDKKSPFLTNLSSLWGHWLADYRNKDTIVWIRDTFLAMEFAKNDIDLWTSPEIYMSVTKRDVADWNKEAWEYELKYQEKALEFLENDYKYLDSLNSKSLKKWVKKTLKTLFECKNCEWKWGFFNEKWYEEVEENRKKYETKMKNLSNKVLNIIQSAWKKTFDKDTWVWDEEAMDNFIKILRKELRTIINDDEKYIELEGIIKLLLKKDFLEDFKKIWLKSLEWWHEKIWRLDLNPINERAYNRLQDLFLNAYPRYKNNPENSRENPKLKKHITHSLEKLFEFTDDSNPTWFFTPEKQKEAELNRVRYEREINNLSKTILGIILNTFKQVFKNKNWDWTWEWQKAFNEMIGIKWKPWNKDLQKSFFALLGEKLEILIEDKNKAKEILETIRKYFKLQDSKLPEYLWERFKPTEINNPQNNIRAKDVVDMWLYIIEDIKIDIKRDWDKVESNYIDNYREIIDEEKRIIDLSIEWKLSEPLPLPTWEVWFIANGSEPIVFWWYYEDIVYINKELTQEERNFLIKYNERLNVIEWKKEELVDWNAFLSVFNVLLTEEQQIFKKLSENKLFATFINRLIRYKRRNYFIHNIEKYGTWVKWEELP